MKHAFDMSGKIALITGGGTGIGKGIAEEFLKLGAIVVLTGRRLAALQEAQKSLGDNCHIIVNDVTEKEEHPALLKKIEEEIGALDILVNNAGKHNKNFALETSDADFQAVIDTNLNSVFALTRAALKYMVPRRKGSIINISSMTAFYGIPQVVAYSSSKTALIGLTRTLAVEYSGKGIRINAIAPGFIDSKMLRGAMDKDPERKQKVLGRTPAGKFGDPSDIGKAAVYLASDASSYVTGICLPVDGGNSIGF